MPHQRNPDEDADSAPNETIPPLIKAYIDEQLKNSASAEDYPKNKSWKRSWRSASPITKASLVLTSGVAFATIAYTMIAAFQLIAMHHTNVLTRDALARAGENSAEASRQFQVQLGHFDAGLGRTELLAKHAGEQVEEAKRLAAASQKSANAAKSAAETAKKSMEISERAYLTTDSPVLSSTGRDVSIPIVNRGHLPSGNGFMIVHEATINTIGPTTLKISYPPLEIHWKRYPTNAVAPNLFSPMMIPVPLPMTDITKVDSGFQQIILAGNISFNNGFPDTGDQSWNFCYITIVMTDPTRLTWGICDPEQYIPELVKDDGFPNKEYI